MQEDLQYKKILGLFKIIQREEIKMYRSELLENYPRIFTITKGKFVINCDASLLDLFEAYSEIVHYIDDDIVLTLEECIKQKILEKK